MELLEFLDSLELLELFVLFELFELFELLELFEFLEFLDVSSYVTPLLHSYVSLHFIHYGQHSKPNPLIFPLSMTKSYDGYIYDHRAGEFFRIVSGYLEEPAG